MKFKISYFTNRGSMRELNEDSILVDDLLISSFDMEDHKDAILVKDKILFVVADGMGGHAKGEVASKFVLTKLKQQMTSLKDVKTLREQLHCIKNDLDDFAQHNPEFLDMGTVLAGILIIGNKLIVFNIGDCRVYQNNFGYLEQLNEDHSLVYALYKSGDIEYNQMKDHPKKNIVLSALIANKLERLDSIFVKEIEALSNDKEFLICSDGLWESMTIEEMEDCMKSDNLMECLKLKTFANGAKDNFSIINIRIEK